MHSFSFPVILFLCSRLNVNADTPLKIMSNILQNKKITALKSAPQNYLETLHLHHTICPPGKEPEIDLSADWINCKQVYEESLRAAQTKDRVLGLKTVKFMSLKNLKL